MCFANKGPIFKVIKNSGPGVEFDQTNRANSFTDTLVKNGFEAVTFKMMKLRFLQRIKHFRTFKTRVGKNRPSCDHERNLKTIVG